MDLFVNDLSFHGQFTSKESFRPALKMLLDCRKTSDTYNRNYYVLRHIAARPVIGAMTFREVVQQYNDRNLERLIMGWIDKHGPFADDPPVHDATEYYGYGDDVLYSKHAPAEVAARVYVGHDAALVSVSPSNFTRSPIVVEWHQAEITPIDIDNYWSIDTLTMALQQRQLPPATWAELLDQCETRYQNLVFLKDLQSYLDREPFNDAIGRQVLTLLDVLNRLKASVGMDGRFTADGEALLDNYFRQQQPRFSDASDSEKTPTSTNGR